MEDSMIMFDDRPRPPKPDDVRDAVLRFLMEHEIPLNVARSGLQQCVDFLRDVQRVQAAAAELGLNLSGFRSGDALALYFDVEYNGRGLGFIYRGWNDPGFGVGETVPIAPDSMALFMAQSERALRMLATNGLGVTTKPMPGGGYWLDMTSVIYSDGFNTSVLAATLHAVSESADSIRSLVA
jgi:hypothetical protein